MPELPEVETVKEFLKKEIIGDRIISYLHFRKNYLRYELKKNFRERIINYCFTNVYRLAKYLVLELSSNYSLIFHFGMTGKLIFREENYEFKKNDHIAFYLNSKKILVFNDQRRFGMIDFAASEKVRSLKYFKNIGVEPLSAEFKAEYLISCFKNKKSSIKSAIMNKKIVVGIGNIYASESLFRAKISPLKTVNQLTKEEIYKLVKSIIEVLKQAIKEGGTTIKDFVNCYDKPGFYKNKLNVYNRKNLKCNFCSMKIIKLIQNGRSTYFCPICQH